MGTGGSVDDGRRLLLHRAQTVLELESKAIADVVTRLGVDFCNAVEMLYECRGKVVVTGVGKSGLISQKIAATLASTGTPAIFLHPVEGLHGDIGILTRQDIVIAVSNSGETEEVNRLIPLIKRMGIRLIAITGRPESTLGQYGDVVIDTGVRAEACPMNLVPTASTAAAMAVGDALAVTLLEKRGFKEEDFAQLHPGGALGRRLLLKVEDLMHKGIDVPIVAEGALLKDAIFEITGKRFGVTAVVNGEGDLIGVVTDGDLRRGLEKGVDLLTRGIDEIMTRNPKTIQRDDLAARALERMETYSITSLIVVKPYTKKIEGIVHVHDLLRAGIV